MSEAQTVTIADFLLARIAEQKSDVEWRGTMAVGHREACIYEGGYEGTTWCDCGAVVRALAECEAKEQVVGACANAIPASQWLNSSTLHWVAMALALPYSDHPDYRPEWRP